jgi:hypothetical protein
MSKYAALAEHLTSLTVGRWRPGFSEIEKILQRKLPSSARLYPAWWANQKGIGHSQTLSWLGVGWETAELDLASEKVTFVRTRRAPELLLASDRVSSVEGFAETPAQHEDHKQGISIARAKAGLSAYYDVPLDRIEITIRG